MEDALKNFLNEFFKLVFGRELNFSIGIDDKTRVVVVSLSNDPTNQSYLGRVIGRNKLNLKSIARVVQIWFKPKYPQYGLHLKVERGNERKKEE